MKKSLLILAVLALFIACSNNNTDGTTYTVTFNVNHEDVTGWKLASPDFIEVSPNQTVGGLPTAPTRANHNFVKWTVNKDGSGSVFTEETPVDSDITVYAQWQIKGSTPDIYSIVVNKTGDVSGDSVAVSPNSGGVGASITINYTLADGYVNNRLVFSGTEAAISQVNQAETGTRTYTIAADDANENGVITLYAVFTHTDKSIDTIAFEDSANVNKTYGDSPFTRAVANSGSGSGGITYSSSNTGVATVNSSTGSVTILKAGDTTITATKAADAAYEGTMAEYRLSIARRQLIISDPTITPKTYDGTTTLPPANVAKGSLTNVIGGDVVTVVVNSAEYDTADAGTNKTVTVFYAISGADADNYNSPVSQVTVPITKASGAAVAAPAQAGKTANSITVSAVSAPTNGQTVEYAASTNATAPQTGWQSGTTLSGLTASTNYYVYARSAENGNYNAGTAARSVIIKTDAGSGPPPQPPDGSIPPSVGAIDLGYYRNLFVEFGGKTQQQVDQRVNEIWNQLFVNGTAEQKIFVEVGSDKAYIYTADTNDVRSEGMSYGMMMCVQMDDKVRFDKLWKWTYEHMYNHRDINNNGKNIRGFFSWQMNTNGTAKDTGPAPDGEFYFATSLLFASARWGDGTGMNEYGRWARNILFDMLHRYPGVKDNYGAHEMFHPTYKLPVFTTVSSLQATHTDPSYILPAFFDVWAMEIEEGEDYWDIWDSQAQAMADAQFYREAATAGRAFFAQTTNSTTGLGPDYASWTGAPTGSQQEFRYDAWRIAMNIAMDYAWWAKDPWQITHANRIQNFFKNTAAGGVTGHGALFNLNGTLLANNSSAADHSPGLVGCNTVASLAASNVATATEFVNHFFTTNPTTGKYRYYDGCLVMMSLLHVSGKFKAYFPANRVKSAQITPTTAIYDKNASGQYHNPVQVTLTLNGNALSNIKNGNTTLVQGSNGYTVSGSTVTITTTYLGSQANGAITLTFNFSAGKSRTIQITIGDTTGGGSISGGGTSYDFTTNPPNVNVTVVDGAGVTATVSGGALNVSKTSGYSTPYIILPFNLGLSQMSSFTKLRITFQTATGDLGSKTLLFKACSGTTWSNPVDLASMSTGSPFTTGQKELTRSGAGTLTGEIMIGFTFGSTNPYELKITSIELVP